MEKSHNRAGKEHKRLPVRRNEGSPSANPERRSGKREREYVIHAAVNAPIYCQFRVKAKTKKEALAKAMAPAEGHGDKKFGSDEWDSNIWQEGNWIKNVAWSEAEDFRILGVDRDNGTKTINR